MSHPPDKFQQPILDKVASGTPNLRLFIDAVAGSGKSTTIEMTANEVHKSQKVSTLTLAFNSHIKDELKARVKGNVATSHSHAFSALRAYKKCKSPDNFKYYEICQEIADENFTKREDKFKAKLELRDIFNFCAQSMVDMDNHQAILNTVNEFGLDCFHPNLIELVKEVKKEGLRSLNKYGEIDFLDMIYWPIELGLKFDQFDLVQADESQDFNMLQVEIAKRSVRNEGSLVYVGDPFQCQPPETIVKTKFGEDKLIKDIKINDKVMSFISDQGRFGTGTVTGVAYNSFYGKMIEILWCSKKTRCTPNHKFFVKWNEELYRSHYCVYLMKQGNKFRIGKTKLMLKNESSSSGISSRLRQEKGECSWILGVYKTEAEAINAELKFAWKFHIPTLTFQEGIYGKDHKFNVNLNQEFLDSFYADLGDLTPFAEKLLNSLEMDISLPFCERGSYKKMGKNVFLIYACNIIPGFHCLPRIGPIMIKNDVKTCIDCDYPRYIPIASKTSSDYGGIVYSLEIDKGTYIADGIPTHNSMYGFAGALPDSCDKIIQMNSAERMPLSYCYRCPTSHLDKARKIVNHIENAPNAKEGIFKVYQEKKLFNHVTPDTMILCRFTAPLISTCIKLISNRIPASVKGNDICAGLEKLIDKAQEDENFKFINFKEHLNNIKDEDIDRIKKRKNSEHKASMIEDKYLAVASCFDSFKPATIEAFKKELKGLFKSQKGMVTLSSIHRSKGLEFDKVITIENDRSRMPVSFPNSLPWEQQQEKNIKYVAYTRSKHSLIKLIDNKLDDTNQDQ